jgi:hypothetical protein
MIAIQFRGSRFSFGQRKAGLEFGTETNNKEVQAEAAEMGFRVKGPYPNEEHGRREKAPNWRLQEKG